MGAWLQASCKDFLFKHQAYSADPAGIGLGIARAFLENGDKARLSAAKHGSWSWWRARLRHHTRLQVVLISRSVDKVKEEDDSALHQAVSTAVHQSFGG